MIVVGLINKGLSEGSVNWSWVMGRNYLQKLIIGVGLLHLTAPELTF